MKQDIDSVLIGEIEGLINLQEKIVLEIGCGSGEMTRLLSGKTQKIVAIDPDNENIKKASALGNNTIFEIGSGECLRFSNNSFDAVFFTFSLHHQKCDKALAEAFRVLRQGGQAIILEPSGEGDIQGIFDIFEDESKVMQHARKAIASSEFDVDYRVSISTIWEFTDNFELYNYFFERFSESAEKNKIQKIDTILDANLNRRPLRLKDESMIYSLRKDFTNR